MLLTSTCWSQDEVDWSPSFGSSSTWEARERSAGSSGSLAIPCPCKDRVVQTEWSNFGRARYLGWLQHGTTILFLFLSLFWILLPSICTMVEFKYHHHSLLRWLQKREGSWRITVIQLSHCYFFHHQHFLTTLFQRGTGVMGGLLQFALNFHTEGGQVMLPSCTVRSVVEVDHILEDRQTICFSLRDLKCVAWLQKVEKLAPKFWWNRMFSCMQPIYHIIIYIYIYLCSRSTKASIVLQSWSKIFPWLRPVPCPTSRASAVPHISVQTLLSREYSNSQEFFNHLKPAFQWITRTKNWNHSRTGWTNEPRLVSVRGLRVFACFVSCS